MNKEIGNRIKTMRENASLTQDEVAKYLGISKDKYAGIELGIFTPTLVILNQLSKLFKVSVETLTENSKESNYADFNITKETKDKLDMIDLFYANKNLYKKLIYQKQGKGVN
jgi:transcriptional regulator with XRE-family HTH domain|uniref:Helix-turn-helix domain protein n=1 Tax=Siphoviridae sp. ctHip2 TaxID=2827830 RepID=A0A8S5RVJ7_9CAUD|nr:MAG TPA: helix-turn-helix domain protein [Siphoviridae sp. ctHip2]